MSVGNLTVGGTGKTTLTLHLARRALERGLAPAVVCRRYHPGPGGRGDEELMYRAALGAGRVFAGASKLAARGRGRAGRTRAGDRGRRLLALAAGAGRGHRAARRARSHGRRTPAPGRAPARAAAGAAARARGGGVEAGRGRGPRAVAGARPGAGAGGAAGGRAAPGERGASLWRAGRCRRGVRVRVVTATGNPPAVEASAREAGLEVVAVSPWRDHHWFTPREAREELARAGREDSWVLLTDKDAVRWPAGRRAGAGGGARGGMGLGHGG